MRPPRTGSCRARAEAAAEERVLEALVGKDARPDTREAFRRKLRSNELNGKEIEVELTEGGGGSMPTFEIPGMPGASMGMIN
jgi:ATP-dependent HslUV protease ATP-binding subunit HslU